MIRTSVSKLYNMLLTSKAWSIRKGKSCRHGNYSSCFLRSVISYPFRIDHPFASCSELSEVLSAALFMQTLPSLEALCWLESAHWLEAKRQRPHPHCRGRYLRVPRPGLFSECMLPYLGVALQRRPLLQAAAGGNVACVLVKCSDLVLSIWGEIWHRR